MKHDLPNLLDHLHWIGHDSFRLDSPITLYIDPWRLPEESPAADIILVAGKGHETLP